MLEIKNLHVRAGNHEILKGVDLKVDVGEVHSIMGPNGSGKSTLAQVLAGRETYEVTEGEVLYDGKNLLEMAPEERACEGIFMAFQYPVEIPGVGSAQFLKAALNAIRKARDLEELDAMEFLALAPPPLGQRGILGRREETERNFPDGPARASALCHGRDGLWPGHRCPENRRQGRQRYAQPGACHHRCHPLSAVA
jgi:hypothetical protein